MCKVFYFNLVVALLLCSCSTSKNVCGVHQSDVDSVNIQLNHDYSLHSVDSASLSHSSLAERADSVSVISTDTSSVVVVEHIVQTIDSLGNVTIVTDRTSRQQRSQNTNTQSLSWQRNQEESLALYLSYLDSLYSSSLQHDMYHRNDSSAYKQEVSAPRPSLWQKIGSFLETLLAIVFFVTVLCLATYSIKYWIGK